MNKQIVIGLCVGGLLATAAGAIALRDPVKTADIVAVTPITLGMEQQYAEIIRVTEQAEPGAPRFAEVTHSRPIVVAGREQEVCEDVTVSRQAAAKDEHQVAGTAAGAVVGGLLGNQVGGGTGKKLATVTGAIVGGVVGKTVQTRQQGKQTYETLERQCRTELGASQTTGYDVTYHLDGASRLVRLGFQPGEYLPVVDGNPVTDKNEAARLGRQQAEQPYQVIYTLGGQEGSVIMASPPKPGELLLAENGQVITDAVRLAEIEAAQHQVIAYRVSYRLGQEQGEVRLAEKPASTTLKIKSGRVVLADAGAGDTTL